MGRNKAAGVIKGVKGQFGAGEGERPFTFLELEIRKRWILASLASAETVMIDGGATQALSKEGRSLPPAGITAVTGPFDRGDTVSIAGSDGRRLGRGIVCYRADELKLIRGYHSDSIAERLGYAYDPVATHRNDLILV